MSRHTTSRRALLALVLTACPKAPVPATDRPSDAGMAALAALMKNQINPSFSKLTFLVFHGAELQEDPNAVRLEMQRAATQLRGSISELRDWRELPTQSKEGRDVFNAFATSVDRQAQSLFDAIQHGDGVTTEAQMQDMADTCNNCHHFFRLKIDDSVVPGRAH
jgi:cytochrome c556